MAGLLTAGVIAIANNTAYLNGNSEGSISTGAITNTPIIIANNVNKNRSGYCNVKSVALYNIVLAAAQIGLLTTAMAAL